MPIVGVRSSLSKKEQVKVGKPHRCRGTTTSARRHPAGAHPAERRPRHTELCRAANPGAAVRGTPPGRAELCSADALRHVLGQLGNRHTARELGDVAGLQLRNRGDSQQLHRADELVAQNGDRPIDARAAARHEPV